MPFVVRDEVRLAWRSDGDAQRPCVLLLNSLGTDFAMWDGVVAVLEKDFFVLRMDARGHGGSDAPAGEYSIAGLARDALVVLDAADRPRAAVCGVSLGGMIALALGLSAPDRVSHVIAANSSAQMPSEPWCARAETVRRDGMAAIGDMVIERFFAPGFHQEAPETVARARATLLATDPQGYAGCCMAIAGLDLFDKLSGLRPPLLVITGDQDQATPADAHGDKIRAQVPKTQTVRLDAGHLSAIERPEAFAQAVRDFLSE